MQYLFVMLCAFIRLSFTSKYSNNYIPILLSLYLLLCRGLAQTHITEAVIATPIMVLLLGLGDGLKKHTP